MPDATFDDPRLAALYDPLDPDRSDLDVYVALAQELGARSVLDVGCGTGTFALLLAARGCDVVGVDPARASVDVARAKPGADAVRWVVGEAAAALPLQVDLVTMTANVAQVFTTEDAWREVLHAAHEALRPGGHLAFETRDPTGGPGRGGPARSPTTSPRSRTWGRCAAGTRWWRSTTPRTGCWSPSTR